jgi:hypothetical protein
LSAIAQNGKGAVQVTIAGIVELGEGGGSEDFVHFADKQVTEPSLHIGRKIK